MQRSMRAGVVALVCLLWGCPSDVAESVEFACDVHSDCQTGWFCDADNICRAGSLPADVGVDQGDADDAGPKDAATPVDSAPLDAAPPVDARPPMDAGVDTDGDGKPDGEDNCPDTPNPDQADRDADGVGDACQDMDLDGVFDREDNCLEHPNPDQRDRNGNRIGDACEVACRDNAAPCMLLMPQCDADAVCGTAHAIVGFPGECEGLLCANFEDQPVLVDEGVCAEDEVCQLDAEVPCVPDEICMPPEGPCDAAMVGRPCRYERAFCIDPEVAMCGGAFVARTFEGICEADLTCSDGPMVEESPQQQCGLEMICTPSPDGTAACQRVDECGGGLVCTPQTEGAQCQLADQAGRQARCVDSVCQPWDCVNPNCNELGPRRFSTDNALRAEGEHFVQIDIDLVWGLPGGRPMTLAEAHSVCRDFAVDERASWRLPTMYELQSLAARDADRGLDLSRRGILGGRYVSRTVMGPGSVYGISLVDGAARPMPSGNANGHLVACVFERNAMGQDTWNLTARREAFTDWGGTVYDVLTDLEWSSPAGAPEATLAQAQALCEGEGATLPTVQELVSLLTFNAGARLPSAGYWLEYNGEGFGQADSSFWTSEPSLTAGDAWKVSLQNGATETTSEDDLLKVVCVQHLRGAGPEPDVPPDPGPEVPPDPDGMP